MAVLLVFFAIENTLAEGVDSSLFLVRTSKSVVDADIASNLYPWQSNLSNKLFKQYVLLETSPATINSSQLPYHKANVDKVTPFLIEHIQLGEIELSEYKNQLQKIDDIVTGRDVDLMIFLEELEEKNLPVELVSYLKLLLVNIKFEHQKWEDVATILRDMNHISADTVITQCDILTDYYQYSSATQDSFYLEFFAKLASDILMLQKNIGSLSVNMESGLTIEVYEKRCRELFLLIPDMQNKLIATSSANWGIEKDAQAIFEYLTPYISTESPLVSARLINYLWLNLNFNNQHTLAEHNARLAIKLLSNYSDQYTLLNIALHNKLFSSLTRSGKFGEAQYFANRGLNLSLNSNKITKARMQLNMGFLYYYVGEYEISKRYFESSVTTLSGSNDHYSLVEGNCRIEGRYKFDIAYRIGMIGTIFKKLEYHDLSIKYLKCGIKILNEIGSHYELVLINELGLSLHSQGSFDEASNVARQVLNDKRSVPVQKIDALTILLAIDIQTERYKSTEYGLKTLAKLFGYDHFYQENLLEVNDSLYPLRQIEVMRNLVLLHSNQNELDLANFFAHKALTLIEQHLTSVANPLAWKSAQFSFIQTYVGTLMKDSRNLIGLTALFDVLERHYTLSLRDGAKLFSYTDIESSNIELDKWFNAEKRFALNEGEVDSNKAKKQIDRARDNVLSLLNVLRKSDKQQISNTNLLAVQKAMASDEIVVRYFSTDEEMHVLMIAKNEIELKSIGKHQEVSKFIGDLEKQHVSRASSRALFAKRLLPIKSLETYSKIIVIPDKSLHKVPFALLNLSDTHSKYIPLGGNKEIVSTYSVMSYFFDEREESRTKDSNKLAIFASPSPASAIKTENDIYALRNLKKQRFPTLAGATQEAEHIAHLFRDLSITMAVGEKATNEFLLSPKARTSNILHIATHGYFSSKTPEIVGLLTAGKEGDSNFGFLSISELLSGNFFNDLVVVSGCETLLGKNYKGSGMQSVTRGFLSQGAGSVIGTLWPVQDKATSKFMAKFYENLKFTQNSSTALHLTQKQFFKFGRYRHPKYWAGFVLTVANRQYENIKLD